MTGIGFSEPTAHRLRASGLSVVVTGAGGWLGKATLAMLESCLGSDVAARVHLYGSTARMMTMRSGVRLPVKPLSELPQLQIGPHLLAHYAFVTRELIGELGTREFIERNQLITTLIADHVAAHRPFGVALVSSGAVYLGDDISTNPYGVLKARAEHEIATLIGGMSGTESPRLIMPRLFNLAGPFLNKPDHYVLGSIIRDVARGGPIRIRADHRVIRSYVHVCDLVDLMVAALVGTASIPPGPFDTAGEVEVEVGELADLVATVLGHRGMPVERPDVEAGTVDRYVGDPGVMIALARSLGLVLRPLPRQIEDTARTLPPS